MHRLSRSASVLLALAAAACARAAVPAPASPVFEGRLHLVRNGHTRFFLTDDAGTTRELDVSEAAVARAGGAVALDGRRVRVFGRAAEGARIAADSLATVGAEARP